LYPATTALAHVYPNAVIQAVACLDKHEKPFQMGQ
jgi:hypothetical protein